MSQQNRGQSGLDSKLDRLLTMFEQQASQLDDMKVTMRRLNR